MMTTVVGILGAGGIGQAVALRLIEAGIGTLISNRRGPHSLLEVVAALGPRATAVSVEQAAEMEIVILAVPWSNVASALSPILDWEGRILIDATNPIVGPGDEDTELGRKTSSEIVAQLAPGAQLVKAFNTLPPPLLAAEPRCNGGRRVIFFSGDHVRAKGEVARLIERLGFAGIDLGSLATGGRLQQVPGGPLAALDLIRLD